MPVKIYTGNNCISQQKESLLCFGKNCLIVTGASSAKKSGALKSATDVLDEIGIRWVIYDKITPNPFLSLCMEAGRIGFDYKVDFIVGIGGGSVLDAAKAIAVFTANPTLSEDEFYSTNWPVKPLPIVLIGTTAGTGSEVTNVAVLTDSKLRKHSLHDNRMYASLSLGDPSFTMKLPKSFTISTGIDILTHCVESYFSKKANDISRSFSISGIKMLYNPLLSAANDTELDYAQREQLYNASIFGGLAISITGTVFPHNVGYYLTENYKVPHGIACANFLPDLLKHIKTNFNDVANTFYKEIGLSENDLLLLIEKCVPDLGIHMTDSEIIAALPRWENNGSVKNTLGNITVDDIHKILKYKFF